jgi:hypothetical protein
MAKTPYEIRLELLKLAKDILTEPIVSTRDNLMQQYYIERQPNDNAKLPTLPDYPSSVDVIKEAEKLNAFISNG